MVRIDKRGEEMGRLIEAVEWGESVEHLYERCKAEQRQDVARRKRLIMASRLLGRGEGA
jgi:hypothetical protein